MGLTLLGVPPIGEMPPYLSGSRILIDDPRVSALTELPENELERHHTKRDIQFSIEASGAIGGQVKETNFGNRAIRERNVYYESSAQDHQEYWRDFIASDTRDADVLNISVDDDFEGGRIMQVVDFSCPYYGRSMRNRLLVFKPFVVSRYDWTPSKENERKTSFARKASFYEETTEIQLPDGWIVDEMGESVQLKTEFGSYMAQLSQEEDKLVIKRKIIWNKLNVPPESYGDLVSYYEQIVKAENTPVVLIRKS